MMKKFIFRCVTIYLLVLFAALITSGNLFANTTKSRIEKAVTFLIERDPHPYQKNTTKIVEISQALENAAKKYDLDPYLLTAMAFWESHFSPRILNLKKFGPAGEKGILQCGDQCMANCPYFINTIEGQALCGANWLRRAIDDCKGEEIPGLAMYADGTTCNPKATDKLKSKINRRIRLRDRLKNTFAN